MSTPNGTPRSLYADEHDCMPDLKRLPTDPTGATSSHCEALKYSLGCGAAGMRGESAERETRLLQNSRSEKRRYTACWIGRKQRNFQSTYLGVRIGSNGSACGESEGEQCPQQRPWTDREVRTSRRIRTTASLDCPRSKYLKCLRTTALCSSIVLFHKALCSEPDINRSLIVSETPG